MWMEEHIGKRVNHERVEEALDTGASKIATGCPFCRVMMTDGVDDRAEAMGKEKAEVLDVAQLLLGSLDKSTVTLPPKGAAAEAAAAKVETAPKAPTAPAEAPPVEAAPAQAKADTDVEAKPVTGLGIAGGAKRPGAKKTAPAPADKPAAAAPPPRPRPQHPPPRDSGSPPAPNDPVRRRPPRPPRPRPLRRKPLHRP